MLSLYGEQIQHILFRDAAHAWNLVSLCYIIATLLLQFLLTYPVKKASGRISSKNLKSLQSKYLLRSLLGWFFYITSWGLFLLFWYAYYFHFFELQNNALLFAAGSALIFLFSVIFHLSAYAASCLDQIKQLEDQQLTV